ncbi:MAG TPA: M56 family metallopeptidase [Acidobacteriaceae bacterium]|jgi:hypothetical protein|nr:M56 family metallopeptidase [Acidobacteriaceae bacterium]
MNSLLLESVIRSLALAALVWIALWALRIRHVLAQKVAWSMVLAAAIVMPVGLRLAPSASRHGWGLPLREQRLESILTVAEALSPALPHAVAHPDAGLVAASSDLPVSNQAQDAAAGSALKSAPESPARMQPTGAASPSRAISKSRHRPESAFQQAPQDPESHGLQPQPVLVGSGAAAPKPELLWRAAFLVIYGTVCAFLLLRLAIGVAAAFRLKRGAVPAGGIKGEGDVRVSPAIASPVTIGGAILLPPSYAQWEPAKLRAVLAHERCHIRQRDFYVQLAAQIYAAFTWFSPLGWFLQRTLSGLAEAWSDRCALVEMEDRTSYAELLLEFATLGVAALGVGLTRSANLSGRIERLLDDRRFLAAFSRERNRIWAATLCVLLAIGAATCRLRVEAAETSPLALAPILPPPAASLAVSEPAQTAPASSAQKTAPSEGVNPTPRPAPSPSVAPPSPQTASPSLASAVPVRSSPWPLLFSVKPVLQAASPASSASSSTSAVTDPFAIVDGNTDLVTGYGALGDDFERIHKSHQGTYLWFRHDGKSYVIIDPQVIAKVRGLLHPGLEINLPGLTFTDSAFADLANNNAYPLFFKTQPTTMVQMQEMPSVQQELSMQQELSAQQEKNRFAVELNTPESATPALTQEEKEEREKVAKMQQEIEKQEKDLRDEIEAKREQIEKERQDMIAAQRAEMEKKIADAKARMVAEIESNRERIQQLLDQAVTDGKAIPAN